MVETVGALLLSSVVLAAAPAPSASASSTSNVAFISTGMDPSVSSFERSTGDVSLTAVDRVREGSARLGDRGQLKAQLQQGAQVWRIELDRPGFPSGSGVRAPEYPIEGGVMLDHEVFGSTGLGGPGTQAHAAIALWGMGRVYLNGTLVTDHAVIQAMALSAGFHADDETFANLNQAREGDGEILVLAMNLPTGQVPQGYLQFGYDDVRMDIDGTAFPLVATISAETQVNRPVASAGVAPVLGTTAVALPAGSNTLATTGTGGSGTTNGPRSVVTGIPASNTVANNGSAVNNQPQSPTPLNAAAANPLPGAASSVTTGATAATSLPQGISPSNASAGTSLPSTTSPTLAPTSTPAASPLVQGIAPANAAPATPLLGPTGAGR